MVDDVMGQRLEPDVAERRDEIEALDRVEFRDVLLLERDVPESAFTGFLFRGVDPL